MSEMGKQPITIPSASLQAHLSIWQQKVLKLKTKIHKSSLSSEVLFPNTLKQLSGSCSFLFSFVQVLVLLHDDIPTTSKLQESSKFKHNTTVWTEFLASSSSPRPVDCNSRYLLIFQQELTQPSSSSSTFPKKSRNSNQLCIKHSDYQIKYLEDRIMF